MHNNEEDKWENKIKELFQLNKLRSHQCIVYNKNFQSTSKNEKCGCQRPIRHHSFDGNEFEAKPRRADWNVKNHTKPLTSLIYHSTSSTKFLRCACETLEDIENLRELMTSVCEKPKLIISVYGGRKYFTMSEDIEKEFMDSMAEAAVTPGTWVITSGLNNGTAKLIGEGVARRQALKGSQKPGTLLGMAWWGNIAEKARTMVVELQKERSIMNERQTFHANLPFQFDDKDTHSLEKNHTHFLLLDDGKYRNEQTRPTGSLSEQQNDLMKEINYPKEIQRSDFVTHICNKEKCYGVTIVVEGGINPCLALLNDIEQKRPVIFVQGSGKLADIIASLMELTAKTEYIPARAPDQNEIEHNLRRFPMRARTKEEHEKLIKRIKKIMDPTKRMYLTVFRINDQLNLKQTILQAIFKAHFARTDDDKKSQDITESEVNDEMMHKEHLLELAIKWNCFDQATDLLERLQYIDNPKLLADLFKLALDENRPTFIDFFLRINYDPRQTFYLLNPIMSSSDDRSDTPLKSDANVLGKAQQSESREILIKYKNQVDLGKYGLDLVLQLYKEAKNLNATNNDSDDIYVQFLPTSMDQLEEQYTKWIGNFMVSPFRNRSLTHQIWFEICATVRSFKRHLCWCKPKCCVSNSSEYTSTNIKVSEEIMKTNPLFLIAESMENKVRNGTLAEEGTQVMLRDLLFWAIFTDRIEMAKVLILHIKPRISAALICVAILKNRARKAPASDKRHLFKQYADEFEIYATECVNACYAENEQKACELLIREIPLLSNITCMQIAISSGCSRLINTNCFSQTLNRVWFNKLGHVNFSYFNIVKMAMSLLTFGLLAPWLISYRLTKDADEVYEQKKNQVVSYSGNKVNSSSNVLPKYGETSQKSQLSYAGVNYYTRYTKSSICTWKCYVKKIKHFHQCPMVKMCYDFASYIWLLLVFTYMMLFKFDSTPATKQTYDWTEIYLIITISVMLFEDIRRKIFYYLTFMRESKPQSWISWSLEALFKIVPYALFYIGIILWYVRGDTAEYLTAARIMLAIDLEIWFLLSLKFISVVKILGPKMFMVRNMLRDLSSFLYVAFICIAAYGVVSRIMVRSIDVQFTAFSIFSNIFYPPFWLLYSDVSDEKNMLNAIIANNSDADLVAGATVTHVLLAFQMLFMNILLLNLLIAVFTTTINAVENNTKYIWRHQRYTFIQEYFEKPVLPAPPIILVSYISLIVRQIWFRVLRCFNRKTMAPVGKYSLSGIFKMIPINSRFTERCTAFEHAATYDYARFAVERKKEK